MKGLNLSHFKKVHEDEHSATLMHPKGHQIKIAKKALAGPLKKQLSELPVQNFADGSVDGPVEAPNASSIYDTQDAAQPVSAPQTPDPSVAQQIGSGVKSALGYASDIGPLGMFKAYQAIAGSQPVQDFKNGLLGTAQADEPAKVASQASTPTNIDLGLNKQQQSPLNANPGLVGQLQGDVGQIEKGLGQEAQASGQSGKMEADIAQKNLDAMQAIHQDSLNKYNDLSNHFNATLEDVKNGHIDPNHYMENKSALGKVSTAIGLILGGIGGGLLHQENPALKFLNSQMERDVEAQKQNLGKNETVLSAYMHQFGNLRDAEQMTMATQKGIYATQLEKVAAQQKDPMAQARLNQVAGKLKLDADQMIAPLAQKQSLLEHMQRGNVDPSVGVRVLVDPKQQEQAYKELGTAQAINALKQDSLQSFDHIANSAFNGALSPNDTRSAKQAFIGKVIKESEGRYNFEAASNLADALFPNKTDTAQTVSNKRMRMGQLFDSMGSTPILDSYGIKVHKAVANPLRRG